MTDFVTHYPHLCDSCNRIIRQVAAHMPDFEDTDDPEAPINKAADNSLLCGGHTCRHGWDVGDDAWYRGRFVTLTHWTTWGFFDAETKGGETLYPEPEELKPVPSYLMTIETREHVHA